MALITWTNALLALLAFIGWRYSRYYRIVSKAQWPPGKRSWIRSGTILGETIPKISFLNINPPSYSASYGPFEACKEFGSTITTSISYMQSARALYFVADAEAVKAIVSSPNVAKPLGMYKVLSFFGKNIVIIDGEHHRRHRKVVAPAFSETNNQFVWEVTLRTCDLWFEDIDKRIEAGGSNSTTEADVVVSTMRAALMIISAAAFGMSIPWNDSEQKSPPGHKLIFRQALQDVLDLTIARVLAPKWLYKVPILPKKMKDTLARTETAYTELEVYLTELIEERKRDQKVGAVERKDLLSLLLNGASTTGGLSDTEIKGNTYIFLLAGHETTAHTLAFAFALLALYPDEQEKLYQESKTVFQDKKDAPPYSSYGQLVYALAVFHEALRLFPPVVHIPKEATEDIILPAHEVDRSGKVGNKLQMLVPKGAQMMLDARALHHNPAYWEDAAEFRPQRFVDTDEHRWNRDAFIPFSTGSRSCVGSKFAQVEGACILSYFCRNYKIALTAADRKAYEAGEETFAELKDRMLKKTYRITLTPTYKELDFMKRTD